MTALHHPARRTFRRTALLAALAGLSPLAAADTITVGPGLGQFDHLTITAAIVAASNGDEIVIEPGLYPENIVINSKNITLRRSDTPGEVILFGQNIGRVVEINDSTVTLRGLTVTGGRAANDAGIRAPSPTVLIVEDCLIENNTATTVTGGIFAGRRLVMRDSIVRNNSSPTIAGGVALQGGGPHLIENCVFENNSAGTSDTASHHSGALSVDVNTRQVVVTDTVFVNNSSTGRGGAVTAFNGAIRFDRCTFDSNSSTRGGALWISDGDTVQAFNCLFVENDATAFGGAVFNEQVFSAVNSTFVGNTDISSGNTFEGVRSDAVTDLLNCVVVNPSPNSHTGIGIYQPRYSIVPEAPTTPDANGNFDADPRFVDAGAGNFRLAADSPAIDAGDSLGASIGSPVSVTSLPTDLDGNTRNLDDPNTPNTGVPAWELNIDMGAYEFQPTPETGPGCSSADLAAPFGIVNIFDLFEYLDRYSVGCP